MSENKTHLPRMAVYLEGKKAFQDGSRRGVNPYVRRNPEFGLHWWNGWDAAQKESMADRPVKSNSEESLQRSTPADSRDNRRSRGLPHSFYPHMNKYREVIDFVSKIEADRYIHAGWELIDTHAERLQGRGQSILIYRVGWRRDAGEPVEPPKVGNLPDPDPGPSAN